MFYTRMASYSHTYQVNQREVSIVQQLTWPQDRSQMTSGDRAVLNLQIPRGLKIDDGKTYLVAIKGFWIENSYVPPEEITCLSVCLMASGLMSGWVKTTYIGGRANNCLKTVIPQRTTVDKHRTDISHSVTRHELEFHPILGQWLENGLHLSFVDQQGRSLCNASRTSPQTSITLEVVLQEY